MCSVNSKVTSMHTINADYGTVKTNDLAVWVLESGCLIFRSSWLAESSL